MVADREADTPAGHVEGLGEAEELHAHVLGARGGQEARSHVAVVGEFGVGVVVDHGDVVLLGERHHPLEEVVLDHRAGGVVGIADEQDLGPPGVFLADRVQVGQEAVLRA